MFKSTLAGLAACVASALSLAAATAEEKNCVLDNCADRRPTANDAASAPPRGANGDFDFYVLSLSWSPGFCEEGGAARSSNQCEAGSGRGFVTHGLWPQYEHGFPSDCRGPTSPSHVALERAAGVYPDEGLARHEWRKHGTCSGKSPGDYFSDVKRAKESVTIPPSFQKLSQSRTFSPIEVQRAFIAANPRLRPGMSAVTCRRGVLQEVRICFSKDLREFRACPEVARQACRTREIVVPPPL